MSVTVNFSCGGCDAKAKGTTFLKRTFHGLNGKSYGFGHWHFDQPQDVAPDGWIAFDPYTGCCYCPKCWAEIENPALNERTCAIDKERSAS